MIRVVFPKWKYLIRLRLVEGFGVEVYVGVTPDPEVADLKPSCVLSHVLCVYRGSDS